MRIIIVNPKFATPILKKDLDLCADKVQIIRIIEKALLSKSIIANSIEIVK